MSRANPLQESIHRAVGGDGDALAAVLEQIAPTLRERLAREVPARFQSVLAAEDVLQQTYVDALRDFCHFSGQTLEALERWLWAIARNTLIDAVRQLEAEKRGGQRSRLPLSRESSRQELLARLSGGSRPSQATARVEAEAALERAIASLPTDYRLCVMAFDLEGRSMDSVALELGRSKAACYMIRTRAHRMLRELLGRTSKYF